MSYEKLGFTSGQTLKAEHLNHMEEGIANCASPSWNDLTDKPFCEEVTKVSGDTMTWDGNTDGLYFIEDTDIILARVCDSALTAEDFANSMSVTVSDGSSVSFDANSVEPMPDGFCFLGESIMFVPQDNYELDGMSIEKKGVYFMKFPDGKYISSLTINGYTGFVTTTTVVKPIDEKYLPDSVKGGGGAFVLRPTVEELTFEGGDAPVFCTTNFDELAKALESGKCATIVFPVGFNNSSAAIASNIICWGYNDGMIVALVAHMAFEPYPMVMFTNGTYVPNL